jgi:hypothetical protein
MEVIEPRMRTVDVEGREAGENAWRWEGRMRGVASDMVVVWLGSTWSVWTGSARTTKIE